MGRPGDPGEGCAAAGQPESVALHRLAQRQVGALLARQSGTKGCQHSSGRTCLGQQLPSDQKIPAAGATVTPGLHYTRYRLPDIMYEYDSILPYT